MRLRLGHTMALAGVLALGQAALAQDYFPLAEGNYWVYRSTSGDETFTISVARTLISANGHIYYPVTGYATERKYVRQTTDSDIVYWDQETDGEGYLASFSPPERSYISMLGACPQVAETSAKPMRYEGPAMTASGGVQIVYQVSCPDTGILEEVYLENIGMVQRRVTTIAGPRTYHLVAARVGRMSFSAGPNVVVRMTLDKTMFVRTGAPVPLKGELRVALYDVGPVRLRFNSSQKYEMVVRDSRQNVVYRYSDGMFFLPALGESQVQGESSFPLQAMLPGDLPDGEYQVEAWLATADGPKFAASAGIQVMSIMPAVQ